VTTGRVVACFFFTRHALALIIFSGAISLSHSAIAQDRKKLLVAEPGHGMATLPFYIAMANGFFADEELDVKILTTDGGGAHTNAVLSGQAFAFIGGPEHNAFAKIKGAELRAVVNLNDRATAYFVAKKGQGPAPGQSMPDFMRGKSIAVTLFGGTRVSPTRLVRARGARFCRIDPPMRRTAFIWKRPPSY
jgi:NitT/TauT family transport system substrate-binding protein